ncbi:amino acid ABC transporter substrate-binding protein [Roseomonas sp. SSH11]|uniref:Amino acid ABC transporter substrate-binding protein n=1 Tax=Pararoseomonas baculiformis TaxID=2820812 RepID=A0ABS4AGX6_9PROT|nr:amino acid ABC transporter substrate-binding protein [Pararoseomonas baculiformis]MBP0446126.1 amino acid ABC transporter substrate-binding protein [Pararoseomonas baculiformis]
MSLRRILLAACVALGAGAAQAQPAPDTLAAIRARGTMACAVSTGVAGLSLADSQGRWTGLDADFCRAVAAAVLGDPDKVRFVPTTPQTRFTALQSGEVDLLSRNTTWSFARDVGIGLAFPGVLLHDGQGFIVKREANVASLKELDGATICIQPGSTTELNLADWARSNNFRFTPVLIENYQEVQQAFFSGRCDSYTTDLSGLTSIRAGQGARANDFVILPDVISREPLGPMVRKGDWRWFDVVKWTLNALIAAEEQGITQANAEERRQDPNPEVQRLLGTSGEFGQQLGLERDWALRAIRAVGNYGEMWQRNQAPLGVQRGQNRLARDGGLMWSPPFR